MENQELKAEIFTRHRTEHGSTDFNEIYSAMQEYSDTQTAALQNRVKELEGELERVKDIMERAYENGRLYAMSDKDGLTWDEFQQFYNLLPQISS